MAEAAVVSRGEPTYTLGEALRKARRDAHMEQTDIAAVLGVSRPLVSKWERNVSVPSISEYSAIASATGALWLLDLSSQSWAQNRKYLNTIVHVGQLELALGIDPAVLCLA